ncbi:uncharacterized protein LOC111018667 isoform X2 [Momordica charantia]|uniref:Uncharacterized protein LOC111018667 isoform X2 n=1 Tax=Momordica charantia TaxID=3673 RepID=A0A6J1D9R0_MOMCH|nr:uncharacterized protein LOC111018667 isoform X2 [Momordica charantia]
MEISSNVLGFAFSNSTFRIASHSVPIIIFWAMNLRTSFSIFTLFDIMANGVWKLVLRSFLLESTFVFEFRRSRSSAKFTQKHLKKRTEELFEILKANESTGWKSRFKKKGRTTQIRQNSSLPDDSCGSNLDIRNVYADVQWRPKLQLPEAPCCSHNDFLHCAADPGGDVLQPNQLHKQGLRRNLLLNEVYCHRHYRRRLRFHDQHHEIRCLNCISCQSDKEEQQKNTH